ncbi:MAG: sulfatase-like hydrolase/transferase [Egibacteraceae bacterium]
MESPGSPTTPPDPAPAPPLRWHDVVLSLVALTALAVAQPLLDLLGRNAVFFVAHDAGRAAVVTLAVGLTLLLPLVAATIVLLLTRVHRRAGAALHETLLAALAAILVLVVLRVSGVGRAFPGLVSLGVAAVLGVLAALAYHRNATVRRLLNVAAVAAPVVIAAFLFSTPVRGLVIPPEGSERPVTLGPDSPPVVLVVFDELPLASLLDGDGGIDSGSYPAFARLAADGTFFRNATTVHTSTADAIPAALSGRYTRPEQLPTAADHPTNLFSLLAGTYTMHVAEPITDLCATARCRAANREPAASRYSTLLQDLVVVGSHLVVPTELATGLPPMDQGWRDFRTEAFAEGGHPPRLQNRLAPFNRFIREIEPRGRPTLHFLHSLLPHRPWRHLADGRAYPWKDLPGFKDRVWMRRDWLVAQGYQRHLVQVQLADRLLGRLLDKLEREGMYDRALVIVLADHGASFTPGTSLRDVTRETFGEIGAVPLLVKTPRQADGRVSDLPLESVDIMPTVLDVVGGEAPSGLDGRSAFDTTVAPRTSKRMLPRLGGDLRFDVSGSEKRLAVERKLRLFGDGSGGADPYNLAPPGTRHLLGQSSSAQPAGGVTGMSFVLENADAYSDVDRSSRVMASARLSGVVRGVHAGERSPVLAVAVNGIVAAVTRADDAGADPDRAFQALIPPTLLRDGNNDVDILLVRPRGGLVLLSEGEPLDA